MWEKVVLRVTSDVVEECFRTFDVMGGDDTAGWCAMQLQQGVIGLMMLEAKCAVLSRAYRLLVDEGASG